MSLNHELKSKQWKVNQQLHSHEKQHVKIKFGNRSANSIKTGYWYAHLNNILFWNMPHLVILKYQ